MAEALKELVGFLHNEKRPDLQILALDSILATTGTTEGIDLILKDDVIVKNLINLLRSPSLSVKRTSASALVNLSAYGDGPGTLLGAEENSLAVVLVEGITDPDCEVADLFCMILSNITRTEDCALVVIGLIDLETIVNIVTKVKFNNKANNLHYLGVVLSNLSRHKVVRDAIVETSIQKLLPFTEFDGSVVKRGGIVGTIRNCCFDIERHGWLLSDEVDILPRLLLPLADGTEFSDDEYENMPLELQYLPNDKRREEDPDIRCMLIESITQLCTLRANREIVRSRNAYLILRELHKWEKDRKVLLACENLVDILIRTETEIGKDNIKDAEVPDDLTNVFSKMDKDFLDN
ncbi:hypothetical protein PPYR_03358 [Photinus pyralis]|uniref:Protein HGH1 homolog n=2 Tax=Photinus pyralis TaxID=7054 RepID=A0A1Y1KSF9_PHOPY|nr:protein HGH1 homolog [Photinus pyralis]KAB0791558.1 hypothetical protein PPYR_03358 [Photinus pyralis]